MPGGGARGSLFLFWWVGFAGTARFYRRCRIFRKERVVVAMVVGAVVGGWWQKRTLERPGWRSHAGAWERSARSNDQHGGHGAPVGPGVG